MIKTSPISIAFVVIAAFMLYSCGNARRITYFQRAPGQSDSISLPATYVVKIQPGDMLSIYITSLNPAASSFFNPYAGSNTSQDPATAVGTNFDANSAVRLARNGAAGYIVDEEGMIEIPLIGQLKLQGLSTSQARNLIKSKLTNLLKEPVVNVQLLNFKISVLGEVNRPSSYVIPNERISLPDALTMAGDLTIYGKRTNIMVIRENMGVKEFANVDLTNREVFTSPFYYLHPNDIVYVEPVKARSAETNRTNAILPILFSGLSLLIVVFQTFRN